MVFFGVEFDGGSGAAKGVARWDNRAGAGEWIEHRGARADAASEKVVVKFPRLLRPEGGGLDTWDADDIRGDEVGFLIPFDRVSDGFVAAPRAVVRARKHPYVALVPDNRGLPHIPAGDGEGDGDNWKVPNVAEDVDVSLGFGDAETLDGKEAMRERK